MYRKSYLKTQNSALFDTADGIEKSQFVEQKKKIPLKVASLVLGFLLTGTICLLAGTLIFSGYIDQKYQDRAWPLVIIGTIMFIPGSYYGYIIICIFIQRNSYSVNDIPIF